MQDLPLRFSVPPSPPAWPPSCQGKRELIKRCFLWGWKCKKAWVLPSRSQTPMFDTKVCVMTVVPWGAKAFPLSFSKFLLLSGFSFFPPCCKLFHSCCQAAHSCSDRDTGTSWFLLCPSLSSYPLNPKHCKMLSTPPQCVLMGFLQLGFLPRYSLCLLAKPFGVLTKCLPRLLLRNVHMHMRVMNNASLHARGLVCEWGWMLGWVQMKEYSFEKQHLVAKWI